MGGDETTEDKTVKTEMYSTEVSRWETVENYPYDLESKTILSVL